MKAKAAPPSFRSSDLVDDLGNSPGQLADARTQPQLGLVTSAPPTAHK